MSGGLKLIIIRLISQILRVMRTRANDYSLLRQELVEPDVKAVTEPLNLIFVPIAVTMASLLSQGP